MIVYVDSPFQLMQAYELERIKPNIKNIFVRFNDQAENNEQLTNIIDIFDMVNVRTIRISNLYQKIYYYLKFTIMAFFYTEFVIGDSNSALFKLLIRFHPAKKFILLDDGVATINSPKENAIFRRFTIFPNYVTTSIQNDFSRLRKNFNNNGDLMHVIVGGKFIDEGICSASTYYQALSCIINNLDENVAIVYIPHRGESNEQLDSLKKKFSIDIRRTRLPIELISIELNISPASISNVLSTAIYSMKIIYGNVPIYTYQLDKELILNRRDAMINLYSQMRDEDISIFIN